MDNNIIPTLDYSKLPLSKYQPIRKISDAKIAKSSLQEQPVTPVKIEPKKTNHSEKRLMKAKKDGVRPRSLYYQYVSMYTQEAIDMLVYLMRTSRNEGIKMGSAKAILDKSIPDLKAVEITGEMKQKYILQLQQYAPTDPLQKLQEKNTAISGEITEITDSNSEVLEAK